MRNKRGHIGGSSRAYTEWRAARETEAKQRVERLRGLSALAIATRRPGQTTSTRLRELKEGKQ